MATYFLDSSSIVKRYIREVGSAWVTALADPARRNTLVTVRASCVEVISAITRRQRAGDLLPSTASALRRNFRAEFDLLFQILELTAPLMNRAMDLTERHALRAYDAVQLAAAVTVNARQSGGFPCTLVSADAELNAAAAAEGLAVDNPNQHV